MEVGEALREMSALFGDEGCDVFDAQESALAVLAQCFAAQAELHGTALDAGTKRIVVRTRVADRRWRDTPASAATWLMGRPSKMIRSISRLRPSGVRGALACATDAYWF